MLYSLQHLGLHMWDMFTASRIVYRLCHTGCFCHSFPHSHSTLPRNNGQLYGLAQIGTLPMGVFSKIGIDFPCFGRFLVHAPPAAGFPLAPPKDLQLWKRERGGPRDLLAVRVLAVRCTA